MSPFDGSETAVYPDVSGIKADNDLSSQALEVVCRMLESPEIKNLWALHHHSRANENASAKIAADIRDHAHCMEDRPDLQSFVAEFLLAQLRASKDPGLAELRENMAMMREVLPKPEGTGTHKARAVMRRKGNDHKAVLDMIDVQMGQKPFSQAAGDFFDGYWHHIKDDVKKHPKIFIPCLTLTASALGLMKTNLSPTRAQIDLNAEGVSMDLSGNTTVYELSPDILNLKLGCHSHIPFVSSETAQSIGDALGGLGIHCSAIKNLDIKAHNALQGMQDAFQGGYDFIKIPFDAAMGWYVKNPLSEFGTQTLTESKFGLAYNEAAVRVSEAVYMFNTLENFSLHPIIATVCFIEGFRQSGVCGGTETRETITAAKDFLHRTWHDRPLNYVLPFVVSGATLAHQGDFSAAILAGTAAGVCGHMAHNLKHAWERKGRLEKIAESAKDVLKEFRRAAQEEGISAAFVEPVRKKWLSTKEKIGWGVASLSAYATIAFADVSGYAQTIENGMAQEAVLKSSEFLGAATATGMILGVFLPYNVVEDGLQHIVFGAAGYGIGRAAGSAAKYRGPGGMD